MDSSPSLLGALAMICIVIGVIRVDDEDGVLAWLPFALAASFGLAAFFTG